MLSRKFSTLLLVSLFSIFALAACGGAEEISDPEWFLAKDGQVVGASGADCNPPEGVEVLPTPTFTPAPAAGGATDAKGLLIANGCAGCHVIESIPQARGVVGPSLTGIGSKGAEYIKVSIINPGAVIAEGYADGLMPANFGDLLSDSELDLFVSFLAAQ